MSGERVARIVVLPLLAVFATVVLVFFVFYQAVNIDGPSMLPTLRSADKVLITRGEHGVERGDVVVLIADEGGTRTEIVKRVIGTAGDTVEIREDIAYVNGSREPEAGQIIEVQHASSAAAVTVPRGQIYVMGDNRSLSEDSRYIGTVPLSGVIGRVVAVFAPIQRLQFVR
jgi:signal peptidase I